MHGHGRDGGARSGARSEDPARRGAGQEERGQPKDQHEAGPDEADAADERTEPAAEPPGAEDRELRRRGPGEQVAGGNRVLEVARLDPAAPLDAELPKERDVRRRPAKADASDPAPLPRDRQQAGPHSASLTDLDM